MKKKTTKKNQDKREFNIDNYLNSLPEDIEIINVSHKGLTHLPSLRRFYKLKILNCDYNNLTTLPELNASLQKLNCNNNKLTTLPELNDSLQELYCYNNELTNLPKLNRSLYVLHCGSNKLTSLPELNVYLNTLYCYHNKLTSLPELNDTLKTLYCFDNQLPYNYDGNLTNNKKEINHITQIFKKVKFIIMCVKYKNKFHNWLWVKVRLPMTQRKYHPDNLIELLKGIEENDEDGFDNVINNW
jgi:hypothetical protein